MEEISIEVMSLLQQILSTYQVLSCGKSTNMIGFGSDVTEKDLSERFGSIGRIRIDKKTRTEKIHLYKDSTGLPKGDGTIVNYIPLTTPATITYEDPEAIQAAISWFSGKELKGKIIKVEVAQRKEPPPGSDRGGFRGFFFR